MARFVKVRENHLRIKQDNTGVTLSVGTTAERSANPTTGEFRFNTSLGSLEFFNGSSFVSLNSRGVSAITTDSFTGDGSTTVFTMSTSVTNDQEQIIIVAVGNVFQNTSYAYTVSGTAITFTSPPPNAESIIVIHGFDSNNTQ